MSILELLPSAAREAASYDHFGQSVAVMVRSATICLGHDACFLCVTRRNLTKMQLKLTPQGWCGICGGIGQRRTLSGTEVRRSEINHVVLLHASWPASYQEDEVFVGAPNSGTDDAGAVFVFERNYHVFLLNKAVDCTVPCTTVSFSMAAVPTGEPYTQVSTHWKIQIQSRLQYVRSFLIFNKGVLTVCSMQHIGCKHR